MDHTAQKPAASDRSTGRHVRAAARRRNVVWEALDRPGDSRPHLFCWEGSYRPISWDEWRRGAERSAAGLQALGVRPGARVAAVLTNCASACNAVLGTWLAGATLLSLPTPRRGMAPEEYISQLSALCEVAEAQVLLLEERFTVMLDPEMIGTPIASFGALDSSAKGLLEPLGDDAPALVQYSSGSTSEPKGIVLSMGAISEQERMLVERLSIDADSRGVVWLPLSHDMGLFGGLLLSWVSGGCLALSTPERFLRHPETWLDDAVDLRATLTAAPNFGLALATRRARVRPPKGRCTMRSLVLGGERIELATLEAAHAVLGPYGVTSETLTPAYGLAEGALAVTMKSVDETPRSVWIDRESAYRAELTILPEQVTGSAAVVSCGRPMEGVRARLDEAPIGRVQLLSSSLADGYLDDPEATAARFGDQGFLTEDLGFMHDGELYLLGRVDDMIVCAGRNVHARDIEREMERHHGVRPGCLALVDGQVDGRSHLVLVAEPACSSSQLRTVADEVAGIAFSVSGLHLSECVFVRPGCLPKTPSGKIQRFRCRALIEADDQALIRRVAL